MSNKRKLTDDQNTSKKLKKTIDVINLIPSINEQLIYVNEEKTSWIKLKKLEINDKGGGMNLDDFEELWQLKPATKLQIKIAGKLIDCPRYSKCYLNGYKFSGLDHVVDKDVPKIVENLLKWAKDNYNNDLNQSLVNWYEADGSIGKHSDDTRQLKPDSDIFSFSFGPAIRTFVLEPKNKDINNKVYHIKLEHNTLLIMGGTCQKTHYHSVPKVKNANNKDKRLNITFRCFK